MVSCCPVVAWDHLDTRRPDRIAYLTIQEGWVPVGETQRRPGLHIERPGPGGRFVTPGPPPFDRDSEFSSLSWGLGHWGTDGHPVDGFYMMSSVADSCRVWPTLIDDPEDVTDQHGGIEHMRDYLGPGMPLAANEMCWITDRTPHESMPLAAPPEDPTATRVYRQFFRLVVGPISVWYTKHNTPSPVGVPPEAQVSHEDKFAAHESPGEPELNMEAEADK